MRRNFEVLKELKKKKFINFLSKPLVMEAPIYLNSEKVMEQIITINIIFEKGVLIIGNK